MSTDLALQVEQLTFSYAQLNSAPSKPVLGNVDLNLPRGSRCILVGANGAAGKRLPRSGAKVLGRAVCFDTPVGVIYVETEWAANAVVRSDLKVSHFWDSVGGYRHEDSRDELVEITHVGLDGLVHEVSDREGRRMEIVNGLMAPWEMLLLDEVSRRSLSDLIVSVESAPWLREIETRNSTQLVVNGAKGSVVALWGYRSTKKRVWNERG